MWDGCSSMVVGDVGPDGLQSKSGHFALADEIADLERRIEKRSHLHDHHLLDAVLRISRCIEGDRSSLSCQSDTSGSRLEKGQEGAPKAAAAELVAEVKVATRHCGLTCVSHLHVSAGYTGLCQRSVEDGRNLPWR